MAENEGSEKTERATPKRLEEARKKGQVPRSADLSAAIVSLIGAGFLYLFGAGAANEMLSVMRDGLSVTSVDLMQSDVLLRHTADQFVHGFLAVVPLMGALVLAAVAAPALIGGWNFSSEALAFKGERINPLAGIGRMFSVRSLVELIKAIGKFVFVGGIGCIVVWLQSEALMGLARQPIEVAILEATKITAYASLLMAASLGLIAIIDAPFQLWRFGEDMKMSRDDVRQEMKESDGSPENKSRIRSVQSALSRGRMMQDVPKANVVITNPTHYAVALRYDEKKNGAPVVIAKGADEVAAKIRELAAANGVPLVSAPPLARALFRYVDLGREIPAALYVAVAQILTYVWQLRQATRYGTTVPTLPVIDPAVENIGCRAGVH
jgi:flagellar biosynthetic protein FlhB